MLDFIHVIFSKAPPRIMNNRKFTFAATLIFILCSALIFIAFFVKKEWGIVSLDQIIFNINTPLELGEDVTRSIKRSARQIGIIYILCISSYIFFVFKTRKTFLIKWLNITMCIFPFLTVIYIDYEHNFIKQISNYLTTSDYIENNYEVDKLNVTWTQKKNLVLIIAESLENTYADPNIFNPPLLPHLKKLQQKNLSFDSHISTPASGWTIAGVTNYLFGLPLKLPFHGNDYGNAKHFLPSASSIIEIMENAGYTVSFVSGWDTVFSGYDKLIATHSHQRNIDQKYFEEQGYSLKDNAGAWGFSDTFVFSETKKLFETYQKQKKTFALILKTSDLHFPSGFAEEGFDKYGDIRDAYLSFDYHLNNLVHDLMAMDKDNNTSIIIIGDHLSMQNDVYSTHLLPNEDKRTIYNCFINPAKMPIKTTTVLGSVDIAPSILEAIGCELPNGKFGLGVSLFSDKANLLEQNKDMYFEEIGKRSSFYNTFFQLNTP